MRTHEGNFWIPTDNGLSFLDHGYDPFGKCDFITYRHNDFEPSSLLSNPIKAFYRDKTNRLWIGSYYGGLNIYDKNALKFSAIRAEPGMLEVLVVAMFRRLRKIATEIFGLVRTEGD